MITENKLLKTDFSVFPKQENVLEYRDVKKFFLHDIDTYKIVFIDGKDCFSSLT